MGSSRSIRRGVRAADAGTALLAVRSGTVTVADVRRDDSPGPPEGEVPRSPANELVGSQGQDEVAGAAKGGTESGTWAANEGRLAALLAYSSDIITVIDRSGRIVYGSPATTRILGYPVGANVGADLLDIVHPDDRERVAGAIKEGIAAGPGAVRVVELRVAKASGEWCHIEAVASNHLDDPAVGGIVVNSRDVTERVRAIEQLRYAAYHDPLTGLPNRALLFDRLGQALARSSRSGGDVAVLFIDLDGFKQVNDAVGHAGGDAVLHEVGCRLLSSVRPADTVARVGGDEFVIVAEGLSLPDEARALAERVSEAVREPIGGVAHPVRASVGIAWGREASVHELLHRADQAVYLAKRSGGGIALDPGPSA